MRNKLIEILGEENVLENEIMKKHTSFKTGGIADFFVTVDSIDKLKQLLYLIKKENISYFVIGNGTNVLVTDKGFRGIIIKLKFDDIEIEKKNESAILSIGASYPLAKLRKIAIENELDNLEFLIGIPGTIGGAVKMNAGAYGFEIKELITETKVMDENGNVLTLTNDEQEFRYRGSIYFEKKYIILETKLKVGYKNSEQIFEKINELFLQRKEKQPLEYPSAGSTFKRNEKFITAKLIDEAGLKGCSVGGAQVSEKHAGFIINKNNATSNDILNLIEIVKQKVYEKFGENIELEIIVIGDR
ncbi:MAG: UDP-N-acetylmuramate dehydrogenase [Candidatus Scatovivens sp.]